MPEGRWGQRSGGGWEQVEGTVAIWSVTPGISFLDENVLGYLDPKSCAHPVLRTLIVSGTESCSLFDGSWPRLPKLLGVFGGLCQEGRIF